jgi:hypothetical protein
VEDHNHAKTTNRTRMLFALALPSAFAGLPAATDSGGNCDSLAGRTHVYSGTSVFAFAEPIPHRCAPNQDARALSTNHDENTAYTCTHSTGG